MGPHPTNLHDDGKVSNTKHTSFYEFYKSMGHNIQGCQSLKLMRDCTFNMYKVQGIETTQENEENIFQQGNFQPHNL